MNAQCRGVRQYLPGRLEQRTVHPTIRAVHRAQAAGLVDAFWHLGIQQLQRRLDLDSGLLAVCFDPGHSTDETHHGTDNRTAPIRHKRPGECQGSTVEATAGNERQHRLTQQRVINAGVKGHAQGVDLNTSNNPNASALDQRARCRIVHTAGIDLDAGVGVAQDLPAGQGDGVQVSHHEAARRGQKLLQLRTGCDHGLMLVKEMFFISQIFPNGCALSSASES
ncbi:hypothetical protein D3C85_1072680 [compost metagenome]